MGQSKPGTIPKTPRGARCPICSAPADPVLRPFCSTRCADADLSRWLRGGYAIPGGQQDSDEDGDDSQAAQRSAEGANPHGDDEE